MSISKILRDNVNLIDFFRLIMKWNWLSSRTLVGALAMNRVWFDTWARAGNEIAKTQKLSNFGKDLEPLTSMIAEAIGRLGIELEVTSAGEILAKKCPIWDWMEKEKIEMVKYELPCGQIVCGALAHGLIKGINPEYEIDVYSRLEALLAKKEAKGCKFSIKKAPKTLTLEEETCKHMFRNAHCAKFQFCPYNIGLVGMPPDVVTKYRDCPYYEPCMNKEDVVYREKYLPEGNEPVRDGILRERSQAFKHR